MGFDYYDTSVLGSLERLADMATGIPSFVRDPSVSGGLWAAASVFPYSRAARAVGLTTSKALTGGRRIGYRGAEAQLPSSPSTPTAYAQRGLNRAREAISPRVDTLRESESAFKRGVGIAATPLSSRAKVPKTIGQEIRNEAGRAKAARAQEIRVLTHTGETLRIPRQKTGAQTAHWYWAQLAPNLRNAEGLKAVRAKLAEEQAKLAGKGTAAFEREFLPLQRRISDAEKHTPIPDNLKPLLHGDDWRKFSEARGYTAEEIADFQRHMDMVEEGRRLGYTDDELVEMGLPHAEFVGHPAKTPNPSELAAIGEEIRKLDRVIVLAQAGRIKAQDEVFDSLRPLSEDRERIFIEAGRLKPETAVESKGRVMRWLGLEPSGDEIYMGHRLGRVPRQRASLVPGGVAVGKGRTPAGINQKSELKLLGTGQARTDLKTAIEDWQAAQVYDFGVQAKRALLKMGVPLDPARPAVKAKHILVNPMGYRIPRAWRSDARDQLEREGFDPSQIEIADVREHLTNTFAFTDDEIGEMLAKAEKEGHLDQLVQVPEDVADKLFGQLVPAKIVVAHTGIKKGTRALAKGFDTLNDLVYASLIYSNPGYIPANFLGNLAFAGLQQGALLPINMLKAGQLIAKGSRPGASPRARKILDQMRYEAGIGPTVATASTKPVKAVTGKIAMVPDVWPRVSALIHEMHRLKVIPWRPYFNESDFQKIETFLNSKQARPFLNEASDRANQVMIDFDRLGPIEQAVAKRLLFVWPWIRGATRYPFRYALDHPGRSAIMAYVAAGGDLPGPLEKVSELREEVAGRRMKDMPPWLRETFKTRTTTVGGKKFPMVANAGPISPVSTAFESIHSSLAEPGYRTLWEFVNPAIAAGARTAGKLDSSGRASDSYRAAALSNAERLAPNYGLAQDLVSPPGSLEEAGLYPQDVSRGGRLRRASRVLDYAVNPGEAKEGAVRFGISEDKVIDPRRNQGTKLAESSVRNIQRYKNLAEIADPEWQPYLIQAARMQEDIRAKIAARALEVGSVEKEDEIRIKLETIVRERPGTEFADYSLDALEHFDELQLDDKKQATKITTLVNDWLLFKDVFGKRAIGDSNDNAVFNDLEAEFDRQNQPLIASIAEAFTG